MLQDKEEYGVFFYLVAEPKLIYCFGSKEKIHSLPNSEQGSEPRPMTSNEQALKQYLPQILHLFQAS